MSHTTNSRHSPARAVLFVALSRVASSSRRARERESRVVNAPESHVARARPRNRRSRRRATTLCRALASASFVFPRGCPRERRRHCGCVLRSRHVVTRRDAGDVVLASRRGFGGRPRRNRRFRVRVRVLGQLVRSALGRRALSSTTRTRFVPHEGRAIARGSRGCVEDTGERGH